MKRLTRFETTAFVVAGFLMLVAFSLILDGSWAR